MHSHRHDRLWALARWWGSGSGGVVDDAFDFAAVDARSRAMARWLRPALCQARAVCSTGGVPAGTGGAPCAAVGAAWFA